MIQFVENLLRSWDGPLTSELVRQPGKFGLGQIPSRLAPVSTARSVCGFCSTGCGLNIHLDANGEAINLSADTFYPVNLGMACPKGWEALTPLAAPDRATTPLLRDPVTDKLAPVDWPTALAAFCDNFKRIKSEHGPESVAFISTGQMATEEMALLGSVFKFGMGFLHADGNTRQCMATAVTAYKQSFGFDSPPFTYADFEESDVLVFVGANPCIAHPIMWQRVMRNQRQPEIIVVDPRMTETAMAATQHISLLPKSDLPLFYGLARLLVEWDALDHRFITEHTSRFNDFRNFLLAGETYSLANTSAATGLSAAVIEKFARSVASAVTAGKRVSFWWTMGVNQGHEATRTAQALINLALMTGSIGKPGTGANSITGQCNAMGSRLFSNTTGLVGGHDFKNPTHREKVARILDIPLENIPDRDSLAYDQIIAGIGEGKIKGLWVICTNTAHSWIHQNDVRELLGKLDFLVVQDIYSTTETAQLADLILPAAGWGEKEGTFINSERRHGLIQRVAKAPGVALADFHIFRLVAEAWGVGHLFQRWSSPEAAFRIMQELSAGQPCDITGIGGYQMLEDCGGVQWPCTPEIAPPEQERRLFSDGQFFTADKRAIFHFDPSRPMPEPPDAEFPFLLLTGRGTSAQWHTQTRTAKSAILRKLYPEEIYCEIHPSDASRLGIENEFPMTVRSRRGELTARARVTATVQPGQIFLPMHYEATNRLTFPVFDPHSRQPSYKACAVAVAKHPKPN